MIIDYEGFVRALNPSGKDQIDKAANDLAELMRFSPGTYKLYCDEYDKRKAERQTNKERQIQQEKRNDVMFMTYSEFKKEFDNGAKGMRKLSMFNKEHPDEYRRFSERMRDEQAKQQRERNYRT